MRVYCGKDYEEASKIAAGLIAAQVVMKPDCVLGLATGSTPIGTYKCLVEKYEKGELDFSKVKSKPFSLFYPFYFQKVFPLRLIFPLRCTIRFHYLSFHQCELFFLLFQDYCIP